MEKVRVRSVDVLRGIVMCLMALDHTRDFFFDAALDPLDFQNLGAGFFFTRLVTHLCAPTFVFLAGFSVGLRLLNGASKDLVSSGLWKRGLWIIFLEFTVVAFAWSFDWKLTDIYLQVIWALGFSMIFLSGAIYFSSRFNLILGIALMCLHNLTDHFSATTMGPWAAVWRVLHEQGPIYIGSGHRIFIYYPLIPWIGVMSFGYGFTELWKKAALKQAFIFRCALVSLSGFVVLRVFNLYGDPFPWTHPGGIAYLPLAVLKVNKYPPSLSYLLLTLGVMFLLWSRLSEKPNAFTSLLATFGRVPMFFYLIHLYFVHTLVGAYGTLFLPGGLKTWDIIHVSVPAIQLPVYWLIPVWLGVICALYFPTRWYDRYKASHSYWWLSYI